MTIVVGIHCNTAAMIRVKYYFAADTLEYPLWRTCSREAEQIQIVHVTGKYMYKLRYLSHKNPLFTFCTEDGVTYVSGAPLGPRYDI